jgi:SAM-dependent methyltransferase
VPIPNGGVSNASPDLYDLVYGAFKDYSAEASALAALLRKRHRDGRTVLDVGCGTGEHARRLAAEHGFLVDGLDINGAFIRRAAEKHAQGRFCHADMRAFQIPQQYDAVVCLFGSIGYVLTTDGLAQALCSFRAHLATQGIVVVEPWFEPTAMQDGYEVTHSAESADLRVVRRSRTELAGRVSRLHFDYRVETAEGVRTFHEIHELGLFTVAEMQSGFAAAGLTAEYDAAGLTGRGLYVARADY